jgi:site-specific recombinase XerD
LNCTLNFYWNINGYLTKLVYRGKNFLAWQHQLGRASKTMQRRRASLKHFYQYYVDQDLLPINPFALVRPARKQQKLPEVLSNEQVKAFIDYIKNNQADHLDFETRR